jgi:VWFA-related protein
MRLALAVLWLAGAPAQTQETATFPALAERVTVDVVVTDRDGRPVGGLTREDFILEDEGKVQQILEFEAVDVSAPAETEPVAPPRALRIATNTRPAAPSRHFLIVFDDLNLTFSNTDRVRDALRSFLEVQLRDGDRVTIAPTGGGAFWTGRISEDVEDLAAFLGTLRGRRIPDTSPRRITDVEAMRIHVQRDQDVITHVVLRLGAYGLLAGGIGADMDDAEGALESARIATRSHVESMADDVYRQARERTRRALASLETAMASLEGRRGRRAVILASDGFVQDHSLDELQRVREAARRANAALYFLDAGGVRAPDVAPVDMPNHPDPDNLFRYAGLEMELLGEESAGAEALAADTGGLTIRGNDLSPGLGRVSLESRTFYLLGYEPSNTKRDGRFRKLKVQVRRPDVVIRARKGYHAGAPPSPKEAAVDLAPGGLGALPGMLERPDVPLRMTAYVLGEAAAGRATVLLSAEADPSALSFEERDGKQVGAVESVASVTSRDTREVASGQRLHELALRPEIRQRMATAWVPITHSFELPPGRYQATLAVRDRGSERAGTVRHEFDVPDLRALRITTPVLSDALLPPKEAGAPASPAPLARRVFAAGARLFCRFEVVGASRESTSSPRVQVSYEILRSGGGVVTRTDWISLQPADGGGLVNSFSLSLNRTGAYELHLRARDEGTGEETLAVEGFEVGAPQG